MAEVLDEETTVNIERKKITVYPGQVVVMLTNFPHAVATAKQFNTFT